LRASPVLFFFCAVFVIAGLIALIPPAPSSQLLYGTLSPGYFVYHPIDVLNFGQIQGSFNENSGHPVRFYVFDSKEYATFLANGNAPSLYAYQGSSGQFSTILQTPGKYYLVQLHGLGFEQTTENMSIIYTLSGLSITFLAAGFTSIAAGIAVGTLGYQRRQKEELAILDVNNSRQFFYELPSTQQMGANRVQAAPVASSASELVVQESVDPVSLREKLQMLERWIQRMDTIRREGRSANPELFEKEYAAKSQEASQIRKKLETHEKVVP